jgi:hypothetical protein
VLREQWLAHRPPGQRHSIETISDAVAKLAPNAVVLAGGGTREPFEAVADQIRALASATPVLIVARVRTMSWRSASAPRPFSLIRSVRQRVCPERD